MAAALFCERSQWIWLGGTPAENCYLQFRHRFTPTSGALVELSLTAEGQFAAYVNGSLLPATQYPDYPHHKAVSTIRLSDCLPDQENLLEIQVHHTGADSSVARKEAPGLRFELRQGETLLAASSPDTMVRLLPGYHCGPGRTLRRSSVSASSGKFPQRKRRGIRQRWWKRTVFSFQDPSRS